MLQVHLTVDDVARLRVDTNPGQVLEAVFALGAFQRGGPALQGWRRTVRSALGPNVREVEHLLGRLAPVPDLVWMARRDVVGTPTTPLGRPERKHLAATVLAFAQVAVGSYWSPVTAYLQQQREAYSRTVAEAGLEGLLHDLHPGLSWSPPVLRIWHPDQRDLHLKGRGLALVPSLFLIDRVCLLQSEGDRSGDLTLAVPVRLDERISAALGEPVEPTGSVLSALLGPTRAAALEIVAETCATGELAERLGGSLASASQHAKVLRRAGLITTARNRNTTLHTLTSLGAALLQGGAHLSADPAQASSPRS